MGFESAFSIPDGAITEAKLANASVTTDKLANNAVTNAKLSSTIQALLTKLAFFPQDTGDGSDGALNVTSGTTNISGLKQYTSISVSAGATLNITDNVALFCQGDMTFEGNLTSSNNSGQGTLAEKGQNAVDDASVGVGGYGYMQAFRFAMMSLVIGSGGAGGSGASRRGGGGGGSYGQGFSGSSASGGSGSTSASGGAGKYGVLAIVGGNLSVGSSGSVNLSGATGGSGTGQAGGGGGGGAGSFVARVKGNFSNTGSMTCNGGSAGSSAIGASGGTGCGGLLKVWYGGTLSNSGTYTASNGGVAETQAITLITP